MMSLKRKASVSRMEESPNKLKRSSQDSRNSLEEASMSQSDMWDDEPMEDAYQPDVMDDVIQADSMENDLQPSDRVPRPPERLDPKAAEKAERWDELVFIVFAKDNFKQDPSAPAGHSTTTGPLTNAELRHAYCSKFNKEVGAEAAMKRYRNDKQKVYDAFLNHPRHITYAPKQQKTRQPKSGKPNDAEPGNEDTAKTATVAHEPEEPQTVSARGRTQQEQDNIDAGDLREYVESSWRNPEDVHQSWLRIMLTDSCEDFIGACSIEAEHLKSSLAYVEYHRSTDVQELWLNGVARITLQRYSQCISPVRLSKLPQCDFILTPEGPDPVAAVAGCQRIAWDFEATLEIYELATQLRDCHVQNIVLDHWREHLQAAQTYEVGLTEVHLLYDRLSADDPALQFWTQALQHLLLEDESRMDIDRIDSATSTVFHDPNRSRIENDELFHYQYHRCDLSGHRDGMCGYFLRNQTEASYSLDHFRQIARRLLLSEGWEEADLRLEEAEMKLDLELFTIFSSF